MAGRGGGGGGSSSRRAKAYRGVSVKYRVIEIKNFFPSHKSFKSFYKRVDISKQEAAVAHDLARLHKDPDVDEKLLNIARLGSEIQEEILGMVEDGELRRIGKGFYIEFMKENPLPSMKANLSLNEKTVIQEEIIAQGRCCLSRLKTQLKCYHSSRAGRQRREVDAIPPQLQEGNPLEMSIEENTQLNIAKDAEIAALKKACEEKDAQIAAKDAQIAAKDAQIDSNLAPVDWTEHLECPEVSDDWIASFFQSP